MKLKDRLKRPQKSGDVASPNEGDVQPAPPKKIEQQDILEVLGIPLSFAVPRDVFLPDDIRKINFDMQVPHGYDEGQVMKFLAQTRESVKFYVEKLNQRTKDVAKLAQTIDRLQVDMNNLRFDNEIASGVSIMPTLEDTDLENQLMEARLRARNLEDEVAHLRAMAPSGLPLHTDQPQKQYDSLRDELAYSHQENERLRDEILTLKSRIALAEEDSEDATAPPREELSRDALTQLGIEFEEPEDELPLPTPETPLTQQIPTRRPESRTLPGIPGLEEAMAASEGDLSQEDLDSIASIVSGPQASYREPERESSLPLSPARPRVQRSVPPPPPSL